MFLINFFKRIFRFFMIRKMPKDYRRLCQYTLILERLERSDSETFQELLERYLNG